MNQNLFDKRAVFQTLGCLMKHPELIDEYNITGADYEVELFHQLIFSAIYNLYKQKVEVIDCFAIDSLLSRYESQYKVFESNDGVDYCSKISEMSQLDNFSYYIERVKKFSFLRYLENNGYDVKKLYDWTITEPVEQSKQIEKFDSMPISQMLDYVETSLIIDSKVKFCFDNNSHGQLIGQGMSELIENLRESPEMGLPLQSPLMTTAAMGMRLKKIYVRSGNTASGKTRTAMADFCHISIPWYYDTEEAKWKYTGLSEPALFISTELGIDELQTFVLSYVTGINERIILSGKYTQDEEERIQKAKGYIESSSLFIEIMPDFTINDIETIIKKYHRKEGIKYFCFDYIHMSASLIAEISSVSKGMKLREDQILFLFVDRLKVICNTLGIFVLTMTQLNGTYKDSPIKDETMLRGSKAIADRIDMGEISLPPSQAELKAVHGIIAKQVNKPMPNLVRHVYKLRRGKLSKIRVWQYADLGTGRTLDLFVTNYDNVLIPVEATEVELMEEAIQKESIDTADIAITQEETQENAQVFFNF